MRGIVQVLVLAVLSGSAVSGMAVANELARSVAEKPDDVQLQTAITYAHESADRQQPDCRSRQSGVK